ncbi:transposase [Gammaproteobacteria bacterium]
MRGHITMRKIREILRLKFALEMGNQKIANSLAISSSTVHECLRRANLANLSWPLPDNIDDEILEKQLYSPPRQAIPKEERGELDWSKIHDELKRKHVTLMLLWNEYRESYPMGIGYSRFCDLYLLWKKPLDTWMRQDHKAGEKMFVDYAGGTIPISDGQGYIHQAQIFVAVLGASGYIYAEATMTQSLQDWIESHCRALKFFGGVPEISVPDNLKNCTVLAHRYEPDINPTYHDLAKHYGFVVMPARVRKPKDKSLAEKSVQIIQYQILAKLRDQTFFSLVEVNEPIAILLKKINSQAFQKLSGSRLSQFEKLDKPALKPLPSTPYKFAEWAKARLGPDYHIELDKHFYSVPYTFIKKILDVRFTDQTVEIFYRSKRIAVHMRSYIHRRHTTLKEHMPKAHQKYVEWTPERIINWARKIGMATAQLVEKVIETKEHPQLAFRACLGILHLGKSYTELRLEAACVRALKIGAYSYHNIASILKNNLDNVPVSSSETLTATKEEHENIRGGDYFE